MKEKELKAALQTIEAFTSLAVVSAYLKDKDVAHSAQSWKQMIDERIRPRLEDGRLTDLDIRALLREAEDFGRQHVFFFERSSSATDHSLFDPKRFRQSLKKAGWEQYESGLHIVHGTPSTFSVSDVLLDDGKFSIKFVEPRTVELDVREVANDAIVTRHVVRVVRAIDVVRIYENGLLEICVGIEHGTPSYSKILDDLWVLVSDFFDVKSFRPMDLQKLKRKVTVGANEAVKKLVRLTKAESHDADGNKQSLAAGRVGGSLLDHGSIRETLTSFANGKQVRTASASFGFLAQSSGVPSKQINVIATKEVNELIVVRNCTSKDYEYVRDNVARLAK